MILSDGDVVFQPRKVERSGLWKAVGGNVMIFIHKEQELECVEALYPARHYASSDSDASLPRMGERLRLKASFDLSREPG